MIDPTVFCSAPFTSVLIDKNGELIPCCEFMSDQSDIPHGNISDFSTWWNKDLKILRDQFIQGKKDTGCLHCDKKEKMFKNAQGHRHYQNQKSIYPLEFYSKRETHSIEQLEIRFGNYCNLKCIMCGEYASSSIGSEYLKHQSKYNNINVFMSTEPVGRWWENEQSLANLKDMLPSIRECSFSGGEPLIVPELLKILDLLDPNCKLIFISNLNKVSDALLEKLTRFKSVTLRVSCEGINEHNDYVRFGSKWDTIQNNILRLKQHNNITVTINHVLQHTSIFALPALLEWCQENSLNISLGLVYENSYPGPGVLGINSAHSGDVEKFKTWLLTARPNPQLTTWTEHYVYNPVLNTQFHNYVTMLDDIRGTDFYKTFNPTYDDIQH
jgi:radical SAM protein with 4Fe4S-binding SPASM domain